MEAVYQFFETSTVWSINYSGLYHHRRCDNDTREGGGGRRRSYNLCRIIIIIIISGWIKRQTEAHILIVCHLNYDINSGPKWEPVCTKG